MIFVAKQLTGTCHTAHHIGGSFLQITTVTLLRLLSTFRNAKTWVPSSHFLLGSSLDLSLQIYILVKQKTKQREDKVCGVKMKIAIVTMTVPSMEQQAAKQRQSCTCVGSSGVFYRGKKNETPKLDIAARGAGTALAPKTLKWHIDKMKGKKKAVFTTPQLQIEIQGMKNPHLKTLYYFA